MGTTDPVALQIRNLVDELRTVYELVPDANIEGAPLHVYGHSWTMQNSPHTTTGTGEYQIRLAKRLRLGNIAQNGLSGAYMADMASAVQAPSFAGKDRRFTPGSRGIVTLQCLVNDLVAGGADPSDPQTLDFYKTCLRTFLAAVSAVQFKGVNTGTYVGSWGDVSASVAGWYPAGALKYSNKPGDTVSVVVRGDEVWVNASVAADSTASNNAGRWTARVNGVVVGSFSPRGKLPETFKTGTRGTWLDAPAAVKLTGLNAAANTSGVKTLTITVEEPRNTYFAGILLPSATPPRVFVGLEAPRNPAASGLTTWDAWEPVYRQAIIDVCAEFPNTTTVDLAPDWVNPDYIRTTDPQQAHPNDLGMAHIASRFEAAIRANVTAPDPGVLAL